MVAATPFLRTGSTLMQAWRGRMEQHVPLCPPAGHTAEHDHADAHALPVRRRPELPGAARCPCPCVRRFFGYAHSACTHGPSSPLLSLPTTPRTADAQRQPVLSCPTTVTTPRPPHAVPFCELNTKHKGHEMKNDPWQLKNQTCSSSSAIINVVQSMANRLQDLRTCARPSCHATPAHVAGL